MTAARQEGAALVRLLRFISRGPLWAPVLAALLLIALSVGLRFYYAQEAGLYTRLAAQPLPQAVALNRYPAPQGAGPHEAVLRVGVMIHDQMPLAVAPDEAAGAERFFVPFTAPPGGAHEGEVLGGMVLSRQARDAFVQWAVTRAHPQLSTAGVEMTLAGLVERPRGADLVPGVLQSQGVRAVPKLLFLTPYVGRRAEVLAARAAWVRDDPLQRILMIAAVALLLFALNRYLHLRKERAHDPEPLSPAKVRDTAFERLAHLADPDPDADPNRATPSAFARRVPRGRPRARSF